MSYGWQKCPQGYPRIHGVPAPKKLANMDFLKNFFFLFSASMMDIFVMMTCQGSTYFADKGALKGTLTTSLKEVNPTLFVGVPRVYEKIQEKMLEVGRANKGFKKQIGNYSY